MLLKHLLAATAVVGAVSGEFAVQTTTESIAGTITDADTLSKATAAMNSAGSTYLTHLSAEPQYSSYLSALGSYIATRSDAPPAADVTGTSTTLEYETAPAWYTAMPSDLRAFRESYVKEGTDVIASAAEAVINDGGAGAKPTGAVGYVGAGVAAFAGVVAML